MSSTVNPVAVNSLVNLSVVTDYLMDNTTVESYGEMRLFNGHRTAKKDKDRKGLGRNYKRNPMPSPDNVLRVGFPHCNHLPHSVHMTAGGAHTRLSTPNDSCRRVW
jgi:hypothetical protein